MDLKNIIVEIVTSEIAFDKNILMETIEIPPDEKLGDYALPCFIFSKTMRKSPQVVALELSEKLKESLSEYNNRYFTDIKATGPYINFFLNKNQYCEYILKKILDEKNNYASSEINGQTITIDMSSPNIAKPFGIGHLRSTIIGNSITQILRKKGYNVVRINYLGDWGTQFGKLIVGYKKWGNKEELLKNPIMHLHEIYVKVNADESLEDQSREAFKELEQGNKEYLELWNDFKELSIKEFNKIYKILGIDFEVISGESKYNLLMDKTVEELKDKNLLEESQGALIVDLSKFNLGVSLIKKSDGATLYATRDITAAIHRHNTYKPSQMIYEVGQEQKIHFQQLFKVLELMGYSWAKDCVHVHHGLYLAKDGKKFSTRSGKTVFMIDILNETIELAKKTIEEKNPLLDDKNEVARKIAIAAIFYGDLKNNRTRDMVFDIDKFLDFDGDTGPYLQYAYARASSILRKAKYSGNTNFSIVSEISDKELSLIKEFSFFEKRIDESYKQLAPHIIANYAFVLSQKFNEFYHSSKVINGENFEFRLAIVDSFRIIIKESLRLLGISVMEEM